MNLTMDDRLGSEFSIGMKVVKRPYGDDIRVGRKLAAGKVIKIQDQDCGRRAVIKLIWDDGGEYSTYAANLMPEKEYKKICKIRRS